MTNQTPESVIAEAMVNAGAPLMHSRVEEGVASALRAANMLREPGERDSATEELARIKPLFESYSREYPNECNKRVKAEAERDAALAAIERVREIHKRELVNADYGGTRSICIACERPYPCQTIAALDGAPEPGGRWEYGREYRDEAGAPHVREASDVSSPDGHRADGSPYWNYRAMRRRPAGPWLPVEGEKL